MTLPAEPAELATPAQTGGADRRRMLSGGFWAMMIFGLLCLIAAAVVVIVFASRPAPAPSRPAPPTVAKAAPLPELPPPTPLAPPPALASSQMVALADRVALLEARQARLIAAADTALAAAAIGEAAVGPRPFSADMQAYGRALPASADATELARLAAQGAPTRWALASELATQSMRASVAAREPAANADFMAQLGYAVSRVVSVRRLDVQAGGPDALLAKAQRKADEGDLEGALAIVGALPAPARLSLAGWLDEAQRRVEIDQRVAGLRRQALADLAAARDPSP